MPLIPNEGVWPEKSPEPAIEFRNVTFCYPSRPEAEVGTSLLAAAWGRARASSLLAAAWGRARASSLLAAAWARARASSLLMSLRFSRMSASPYHQDRQWRLSGQLALASLL